MLIGQQPSLVCILLGYFNIVTGLVGTWISLDFPADCGGIFAQLFGNIVLF
jgi:hypothetical protein